MKNIFIIGASRRLGLGLEFTKQYLKRGDRVIASFKTPEKALDLKKLKNRYENTLTIVKLNVTREDERNQVLEIVSNKFNSFDILINNVGIISGNEQNFSVLGEIYKEDINKVFLVFFVSPKN